MTVDPGIYTIMAPESLAWAIYDRVGNAKRDVGVTNRWVSTDSVLPLLSSYQPDCFMDD